MRGCTKEGARPEDIGSVIGRIARSGSECSECSECFELLGAFARAMAHQPDVERGLPDFERGQLRAFSGFMDRVTVVLESNPPRARASPRAAASRSPTRNIGASLRSGISADSLSSRDPQLDLARKNCALGGGGPQGAPQSREMHHYVIAAWEPEWPETAGRIGPSSPCPAAGGVTPRSRSWPGFAACPRRVRAAPPRDTP